MRMRLILASASPARLATMRRSGLDPEVIVSDVCESAIGDYDAASTARHLAMLKCENVHHRLKDPTAVVIGCDSVLDLDGDVFGKPVDAADARARWQRMRGRSGVLHTGHCLRHGTNERVQTASTIVHFAEPSDTEIEAYIATGEPLHVAGAFTIDGYGSAFIHGIEGDHHNVVGISVPLVRTMMADIGIAWTDLWSDA